MKEIKEMRREYTDLKADVMEVKEKLVKKEQIWEK